MSARGTSSVLHYSVPVTGVVLCGRSLVKVTTAPNEVTCGHCRVFLEQAAHKTPAGKHWAGCMCARCLAGRRAS